MIEGPTLIYGFMSPAHCGYLVGTLAQHLRTAGGHTGNWNADFDKRTLNLARMTDRRAREIVLHARQRIVTIARAIYPATPRRLPAKAGAVPEWESRYYVHYTDLTMWPEGSELGEHIDNEPGRFDECRRISSVVYLNNEYVGGFTKVGDELLQKRTGMLAMYPAHVPHAVTKVSSGTRYTLATWLTDDSTQEEELR